MRIILWDVDGTLIRTGGAGMRAMTDAMAGWAAARQTLQGMRLDGMTDYKIARLLCAAIRHHRDGSRALMDHAAEVTRQEMDDVLSPYLRMLDQHLADRSTVRVLPGVQEMLGIKDAVHALATGNLREGARLKLQAGGLWHAFVFGGFGSDAEEREDILHAARRRGDSHHGRTTALDEYVVVGDTPRDVEAAHGAGMACVAVATGRFSVEQLRDAGADAVLENLAVAHAREVILHTTRQADPDA